MRNQYKLQWMCFLLLVAAVIAGGCRKNVAAAPPPAPPVQPAPPPPAPAITLRAAPTSIDRGQATSLQWEAKNAATVRIEPELGNVQSQGSRSISPASSVTYTATATGPGGSATDTARITVRIPAAAAPARPEPPRPDTRPSLEELFRQNIQTIYFDYDRSDIRPDQLSRLEANASWLKQNRGVKFTIEGHCDERGSAEYNLGLGDRRANNVKEFLIRQGVDQSSINTISYGEEHPVCKDDTEECHQRNRRSAFVPRPAS
ncbi:MAG TPA: peptidoglycan-associated lipoprotein Pal [Terriglobia bacterium]|nr:peptidoglycan-associated lipoprotein Pal [Terriglobia bacterium]